MPRAPGRSYDLSLDALVSSLYKERNWNVGEFKLVKLECWSHLNRKDVINKLRYFIVDN